MNDASNHLSDGGDKKFRGVFFHARRGKWIAKIKAHGRTAHLGYFRNPAEAALIYDGAALLLKGGGAVQFRCATRCRNSGFSAANAREKAGLARVAQKVFLRSDGSHGKSGLQGDGFHFDATSHQRYTACLPFGKTSSFARRTTNEMTDLHILHTIRPSPKIPPRLHAVRRSRSERK